MRIWKYCNCKEQPFIWCNSKAMLLYNMRYLFRRKAMRRIADPNIMLRLMSHWCVSAIFGLNSMTCQRMVFPLKNRYRKFLWLGYDWSRISLIRVSVILNLMETIKNVCIYIIYILISFFNFEPFIVNLN